MKFLTPLILAPILLFIACNQEVTKQQSVTNLEHKKNCKASEALQKDSIQPFDQIVATTPLQKLPHSETTNFDDFIDPDDYQEIDVNSLQLDKIYPNFYQNNFRAIAQYKVDLNPKKFHSLVVTTIKGTHEMESVLINYNLKGAIIDYKIVAYDEIAEGMSCTQSQISEEHLMVNQIFWGNHKEVKQTQYKILEDGTIDEIAVKHLNEAIDNF
ncbi:MAG: hypothetical protein N4A35_11820 [Flavobacteriales bacterium]|jgi:hypothetical protein|nr:hypothetical protein [Flavobacteriales bacterium]